MFLNPLHGGAVSLKIKDKIYLHMKVFIRLMKGYLCLLFSVGCFDFGISGTYCQEKLLKMILSSFKILINIDYKISRYKDTF